MTSFSKSNLIKVANNIDPVTGYPFETSEVRKEIINIFSKSREDGKIVIFVDSDIDNLKKLNDEIGKKNANIGIRLLIEEKEKLLQEKFGVDNIIVYRHQAGGDEFNTILLIDKNSLDIKKVENEITDIFDKSTVFKLENAEEVSINCSCGVAMCDFSDIEDIWDIFRRLIIESGKKLFDKKMKKINSQLEETIKAGSNLAVEEYIDLIVDSWGSKRLGRETLRSIILDVVRKVRG